jgi:hypothetical protein
VTYRAAPVVWRAASATSSKALRSRVMPSAPGMTWLLYVWAAGVIVADRMWVRPARLQEASSDKEQGR